MGCQVCGAGIDWRWWPEWIALGTGTYLISTQLDWMVFEYLCPTCHTWAKEHGALWDGVLRFKFEGFKLPEGTARMAYGRKQICPPTTVWHLHSSNGVIS